MFLMPNWRCSYSVIRRRCMEKNWKKMLSMRHKRLTEQQQAISADEPAAPPSDALEPTEEVAAKPSESEVEQEKRRREDEAAAAKNELEVSVF